MTHKKELLRSLWVHPATNPGPACRMVFSIYTFLGSPTLWSGSYNPEALRTHVLRLLGQKTILNEDFWAILGLMGQQSY